MGILLCEQNFREVWRRNENVRAEIGQILHTHAAQLVVRKSMFNKQMFLGWYFINIGNCFNNIYPTPLIFISEVMIPNHGNGPKSTHGACPGSKKT